MERLEAFFKDHSLRLTEPRRDIFSILESRDQPLTLQEILKASQFAERTSVYRTLQLFTKLGIVDIVQVGFKQRYELAEPFRSHHHHLVCIKCGELIDLERSAKLEKLINKFASAHDYELTAHHIELQGICKSCREDKSLSQ